ncbi:beta-1,3-glucanase family protein [Abyssalbus ytuae]|uniref:Beta-1,3-glucanase family protein n=1 Tax=Abyssalbus ytuae TaxID=2926907 RepID=A0A9E6ZPA2_9FLAO|nr:beta-1,3-glucanase family protein [Abyssalbus ytuae]UOB18379.1 beta-1,3-glucanase family protein [Abyssalbus ytuae]
MKVIYDDILKKVTKNVIAGVFMLLQYVTLAQTLPYQFANNSEYADSDIYVTVVGIINDAHIWVDAVNGQVLPMNTSYNTVPGPVIGGNLGPGGNGLYADCFRKLSDIPNKTINIPQMNGGKILISFGSQLYMYFHGSVGAPSGYAPPDLNNPTDPNLGIKFENIEFTYDQYGLWCNPTRVDSYQYPMGLEVWGDNGFYKRVGEIINHSQVLSEWQATAPSEFQGLLDQSQGIIHFPTKSSSFPESLIQTYIDQIWSKYSSQQLVFNSGDAGTWRGSVSGDNFVFTRDSDGAVGVIPGKPTVEMAMEASGVMASGNVNDLIVQKMLAAAINRHAIDLNLGSGVVQDIGNPANYYQTWPYNWYAKFFHRTDISYEGWVYAFSYDDVFDQSATVHTPVPNSIKITIGGFAGTTNPDPTSVVTLYQHCPYDGYAIGLAEGSYTLAQLQALGMSDNAISSIKVQSGYKATLYDEDNFTGTSLEKTADSDCLTADSFNDMLTSVIVSKAGSSGWSTQIEAETYVVFNDVQTEACSEGGENVGYINNGSWMVWDVNIPSTGTYTVEYRVASPNNDGTIQLEKAGGSPVYGSVSVPNTGGWQNWTTISHNVSLTAGEQQIAIYAPVGGWNINWLKISSTVALAAKQVSEEKSNNVIGVVNTASLKSYPNPTTDILNVIGYDPNSAYVVYDLTGKIMKKGVFNSGEVDFIDVSNFSSGIYILKNTTTGKTFRFSKK